MDAVTTGLRSIPMALHAPHMALTIVLMLVQLVAVSGRPPHPLDLWEAHTYGFTNSHGLTGQFFQLKE